MNKRCDFTDERTDPLALGHAAQTCEEKALLSPCHCATPPVQLWYILKYTGVGFSIGTCWYVYGYILKTPYIKKFQKPSKRVTHQLWCLVLISQTTSRRSAQQMWGIQKSRWDGDYWDFIKMQTERIIKTQVSKPEDELSEHVPFSLTGCRSIRTAPFRVTSLSP